MAMMRFADADGHPMRSAVRFIQGLASLGSIVSLGGDDFTVYAPKQDVVGSGGFSTWPVPCFKKQVLVRLLFTSALSSRHCSL